MTARRRPPPSQRAAPEDAPPAPVPSAAQPAGEALLGAALISPGARGRLEELGLTAAALSGPQQTVWTAMLGLAGQTVDVATVAAALGDAPLAGIGGLAYLHRLADQASSPAALEDHVAALQAAHHQQRVKQAMRRLDRSHHESPQAFGAALHDLNALINQPRPGGLGGRPLGELAVDVVRRIHAPPERSALIPSGLPDLDQQLLVLPGQLNVLAGRPGMGKTLTGLGFALAAAQRGLPVTVISLEMSADQLTVRTLAREARCALKDLVLAAQGAAHGLGKRELQRLDQAAERIGTLPLRIDDRAVTFDDIEAALVRAAAAGSRLVIIDHLHVIQADDGRTDETTMLGRITARIKAAARRHHMAVWLLAQLSRAVETRPNHRPVLADLRQSGNIEANADNVLLLYRDEYYHPHSADAGLIELIIAKQRDGVVGTVVARFDGLYQRLLPLPPGKV